MSGNTTSSSESEHQGGPHRAVVFVIVCLCLGLFLSVSYEALLPAPSISRSEQSRHIDPEELRSDGKYYLHQSSQEAIPSISKALSNFEDIFPIADEVDVNDDENEVVPDKQSCLVLQLMVMEALVNISKTEVSSVSIALERVEPVTVNPLIHDQYKYRTNYAVNKKFAIDHGCMFFTPVQLSMSCSHWEFGIRHQSFCVLQELLSVLELLQRTHQNVATIYVAGYLSLDDPMAHFTLEKFVFLDSDSFHADISNHETIKKKEDVPRRYPDAGHFVFFEERNVMILRGLTKFGALRNVLKTLCLLWERSMGDNPYRGMAFPEADKWRWNPEGTETQLTSFFHYVDIHRLQLVKDLNIHLEYITKNEFEEQMGTDETWHSRKRDIMKFSLRGFMNPELEKSSLSACFKATVEKYGFAKFSEVLFLEERYDNVDFWNDELFPCQIKIRTHYSRDRCRMNPEQTFVDGLFVDSASCSGNKPSESIRTAVVFPISSIVEDSDWKATIEMVTESLPALYKETHRTSTQTKDIDFIIFISPFSSWPKDRKQQFENALELANTKIGPEGKLRLHETNAVDERMFPDDFLAVQNSQSNCCGWTEYIELAAWTLIDYDSVAVADLDVIIHQSSLLDELNRCLQDYDFLYSTDAFSGLQGGFYWLKPNVDVFNDMMNILATPNLYKPESGWNATGPMFSLIYSRITQRAMAIDTSYGQETPQGFLLYYFTRATRQQPWVYTSGARVGQLEICKFDWMNAANEPRWHGTVDFACTNAIQEAIEAKQTSIEVRLYHGRGTPVQRLNLQSTKFGAGYLQQVKRRT